MYSRQDSVVNKRMRAAPPFYSGRFLEKVLLKALPPVMDASIPNGTPIHQKLAPELLTRIFEYTINCDDDIDDSITISNIRRTHSTFEKAAWPAFARSFNTRVFHPTNWSMQNLLALASNPRAAPYLKTLHVSTVVLRPSSNKEVNDAILMDEYAASKARGQGLFTYHNGRTAFLKEFRDFYLQWMFRVDDGPQELLRKALGMLGTLERLVVVEGGELLRYPRLPGLSAPDQQLLEQVHHSRHCVFDIHAHDYAMEVVFSALTPAPHTQPTSTTNPKLTTFSTIGRIPITAIPTFTTTYSGAGTNASPALITQRALGWAPSTLFQRPQFPHITRLELSLAEPSPQSVFSAATKPYHVHLPAFLSTLLSLTTLNIAFPKSSLHGRQNARTLLFGNAGFDPIADPASNIHFPSLHTLQIANLDLFNPLPLQKFLSAHKSTLRILESTSLGLVAAEWTPFLRFLAREMDLDVVRWKSNLDAEEREWQRRLEERLGDGWRPESKVWMGVARRLVLVGDDGEERVVVRREVGSGGVAERDELWEEGWR